MENWWIHAFPKVKCKQSHLGFKLRLQIPFPKKIPLSFLQKNKCTTGGSATKIKVWTVTHDVVCNCCWIFTYQLLVLGLLLIVSLESYHYQTTLWSPSAACVSSYSFFFLKTMKRLWLNLLFFGSPPPDADDTKKKVLFWGWML